MERFRQHCSILTTLFVMLFSLTSISSKGQEFEARAVLDTNQALIGDQLGLQLIFEKPADVDVDFPEIGEELSDKIVVVEKSDIDTTALSGRMERLEQKLIIAVFDTGMVKLPQLAFVFHAEQFSDTIETLPSFINILPMKLDEDIRDIKSNYQAPVSLKEVLPFILVMISILLIIWFIRRYFTKKFGRLQVALANPHLDPPEVTAMRELEKMKQEEPWQNQGVKPYYIRLSEVLRNYIEQQFRVPALEQTTGEIISSLRGLNMNADNLQLLEQILVLADLVKFAKAVPDQHENAVQVDLAVEYVKQSCPVAPEEDTGKIQKVSGRRAGDTLDLEIEPEKAKA